VYVHGVKSSLITLFFGIYPGDCDVKTRKILEMQRPIQDQMPSKANPYINCAVFEGEFRALVS
jgi:hypothetical protein